jgi:hypothetical protein
MGLPPINNDSYNSPYLSNHHQSHNGISKLSNGHNMSNNVNGRFDEDDHLPLPPPPPLPPGAGELKNGHFGKEQHQNQPSYQNMGTLKFAQKYALPVRH